MPVSCRLFACKRADRRQVQRSHFQMFMFAKLPKTATDAVTQTIAISVMNMPDFA